MKSDAYAYQSEYRIITPPSGQPVRRLLLGSLEDISDIYPVAELNTLIEVADEESTG